jgi:hypothetical protein
MTQPIIPEPCPFCGAELERSSQGLSEWVHPDNALGCVANNIYLQDADDIASWNTRHEAQAPLLNMMGEAAERGLEWAIDAANESKGKGDIVFENAMNDIRRIEEALATLKLSVKHDSVEDEGAGLEQVSPRYTDDEYRWLSDQEPPTP